MRGGWDYTMEQRQQAVDQQPCPTCGAEVGQWCRKYRVRGWYAKYIHKPRLVAVFGEAS